MSIPKTIHYCWFGRNPKPKLAKKCIKSWKKYCPDYEIIQWNEDNFDISSAPIYVRQAYEAKKWAFVTDYVRLWVVYEHGGIYLDTDVELKKHLDSLLEYAAYFGFEDGQYIATGLGFGAEKNTPLLKEIMDDYDGIPFVLEDGSFDTKPCPRRNTEVFLRYGLRQDDSMQILQGNVLILPSVYLCPIEYWSGTKQLSKDTISVHWFSASWQDAEEREEREARVRKLQRAERLDRVLHIPNRLGMRLLGEARYDKLKSMLKKE